MEFLVKFDVHLPDGSPRTEVDERDSNEAAAAAKLADERHLVRLWKTPVMARPKPSAWTGRTARRSSMVCSAPGDGGLDARHGHSARAPPERPGEPPAEQLSASPSAAHPGLPPGGHAGPTIRSRRHRPGSPTHRAPDRRNVHRSGERRHTRAGRQRRLADRPAGRAISATRCGPTAATSSTSDHAVPATAAPRSWRVARAATTSTPARTRSAPRSRSRPPHPRSTG